MQADLSEMVLLPAALRRLKSHSESETVQYCSLWWAAAIRVPWRHEKISSVDLRLIVKQFERSAIPSAAFVQRAANEYLQFGALR